MKRKETGATPIFILVVLVVVLLILGVAANIVISDTGAIREVKQTVKIETDANIKK